MNMKVLNKNVSKKKLRQRHSSLHRMTLDEWKSPKGLTTLRGLAMQCDGLDDLARLMHENLQTLDEWMEASEDIREAVRKNRTFADADVLDQAFAQCEKGNSAALSNWWRIRLCASDDTPPRKTLLKTLIIPFD